MGVRFAVLTRFVVSTAVVCALATPVARAQRPQPPGNAPPNTPAERIHYYNGQSRVGYDLALDELFLHAQRGQRVNPARVQTRVPAARVAQERWGHARVQFDVPALSRTELAARARAIAGPGYRAEAVLYGPGAEDRDKSMRGVLLRQFSLQLRNAEQLDGLLDQYDLNLVRRVPLTAPVYIVEPENDDLFAGLEIANALFESGEVVFATPLIAYEMQAKFVPNDPLFGDQWHLENQGQALGAVPGNDIHVTGVWSFFRGAGARINIVDSGLDQTHEDLQANVRPDLGLDINGGDFDPTPELSAHGTAVAGLAAADGNNGLGVSGVAFEAQLVGVRLIEGLVSDSLEADAMLHLVSEADPNDLAWISNNSWGPSDFVTTLAPIGPLFHQALVEGTTNGRGGRGVVYVWAAGNGRQADNNVNYDGFASSRYTIAVGASTGEGVFARYSEPGASMLVNAPSSSNSLGVVTTDFTGIGDIPQEFNDGLDDDGNYTASFSGTSAAAPIVSGVVALMLQANPQLGWRDVQNILVDTAEQNNPADLEWQTNGSGRPFNPSYGFGRVDATEAVDRGLDWFDVPTATVLQHFRQPGLPIPDGSPNGAVDTVTIVREEDVPAGFDFDIPAGFDFFVEHAEVVFNASHPQQGDIEVTLISPSGMYSVLAEAHGNAEDNYDDYLFTSVAHWGEEAAGEWTLQVADRFPDLKGTFNSWRLKLWGFLIDRNIVFVDTAYKSYEHGTRNRPFNTLEEAMDEVNPGGTVVFLGRQELSEPVRLDKPMRIEALGGAVRLGVPPN